MKIITKNKLMVILLIAFLMLSLINIKVYAADGNFTLDSESIDVTLNGTKYIVYSGGSGTVTWTSSDPSIATVNDGRVEGLKIGSTTITATRGSETASCTVNVVYADLTIGGNSGNNIASVNLILTEHDSENLFATVEDGDYEDVSNASVTWTSSDTNIVTVDSSNGTITAVSPGTAKITATAAGVSDSCDVNVYAAPVFTDFSNAKYETSLDWDIETLKVSGINVGTNDFYYVVTPNDTKPNIITRDSGIIDSEAMGDSLERLYSNNEENYIYTHNISKYAELNQDMYVWIIQVARFDEGYYNENGKYVFHSTKFVNDGEKITRAELPKLNLILQTFNIGYWNDTTSTETDNYTYMRFNFPTNTKNRKFTVKIGKVTDSSILTKIKNNDYSGITDLLEYAKSHDSIYSQTLTTTDVAYFRSDTALFDGNNLLENKAYYYIYVQFDDEDGKYYPIEGVTMGQAWLSSISDSWNLYAYTSSDFEWDNLSPTVPNNNNTPQGDTTIANGILPYAGLSIGIILLIVVIVAGGVFAYFKYKNLKGI